MKCIAPILAVFLTLAAAPAFSQDDGTSGQGEIRDGLSMLSEGARTLLEGLIGRVDPQMRDLAEALRDWDLEGFDPGDLNRYRAPEMLPNGDIIIRRRHDAESDPLRDDEIAI